MSKKASWLQKQINFKKNVKHSFVKRVQAWWYCDGCGLVALNNSATAARIAKPCKSMEE